MSEGLWIVIAVVAVLILVALVVGFLRYRSSKISLPPAQRDETKPVDRSGGYSASSGITFSQGSSAAPQPAAPPKPQQPVNEPFEGLPTVGDDATVPRDAPKRTISNVLLP